ncbi:MAG: 50S ribosomal protein L19 [Calditrichaeota bacterium]|nr:50S ribosomal protein L19 [Calditrichota bacterium]
MADLILQELERETMRTDIPQFYPGDTVSVHTRVTEGSKERIQVFRGTVIRICGRFGRGSFTVRKVSSGIGVERVFPFNSPSIAKVVIERKGKVRRARLYYLRDRIGKAARIRDKTVEAKKKKPAKD